jgi:hypothetical protein
MAQSYPRGVTIRVSATMAEFLDSENRKTGMSRAEVARRCLERSPEYRDFVDRLLNTTAGMEIRKRVGG